MIVENISCPKCGARYFMPRYSTSTAMYFPPIYKDGVNINPDKNIHTNVCECMNCHTIFSYRTQNGEILDGYCAINKEERPLYL